MALPKRVKVKNTTSKKTTRKKTQQKKKRTASKKKKAKKSYLLWRVAGVIVALLVSVGGFYALGGNVDRIVEYFNTIEPITNPTTNNTTTTKDDPELPSKALEDYIPTRVLGDKLIQHQYYTVSYSTKHKNPEWVAYEMTARRVTLDEARRRDNFVADPGLENGAKDSDYNASNYDRGHLAPAEDMNFSPTAMEESFFLSNISPQSPEFNRGVWKKLENHVRKWATTHKAIYIITGPILPKRIDSNTKTIGNGVVVPTRFYNVILDYTTPERKGIAFILANEKSDAPLSSFACAIRKVEDLTGINFFPKLNKAESDALEAVFDVRKWEMD